MSWDVHLEADLGGPEPAFLDETAFNYTYNTSAMLYDVGINWHELTGKSAAYAVEVLQDGIQKLKADPDKYRAMNPPNGWGSYDGLLETLAEIVESWSRYPKATVGSWL